MSGTLLGTRVIKKIDDIISALKQIIVQEEKLELVTETPKSKPI